MNMKVVKFLLLFVLGIVLIRAQGNEKTEYTYEKYKHNFSAGYGVGVIEPVFTNTFSTYSSSTTLKKSYLGPLYFKYEYRIHDLLGVGFNLAYLQGSLEETDTMTITPSGEYFKRKTNISSLSVLMRLNIHLLRFEDNVDLYMGLGFGAKDKNCDETTNNTAVVGGCEYTPPIGMDLTLGFRMFLTENIGLYSEVGMAKSAMQIGITGRF